MNYLSLRRNGKKSVSLEFKPVSKVKDWKHEVSYASPRQTGDVLYVLDTSTGLISAYSRQVINTQLSVAEFDYHPRPLDEYCVMPITHDFFQQ